MGGLVWACFAAAILTVPGEVQVRTLDGQVHIGQLAALTEQSVTVQTGSGAVNVPMEQVAELASKSATSAQAQPGAIVAGWVDESLAAVAEFTLQEGRVRVRLSAEGQQGLECSRRDLVWVRFQPETEALSAVWKRLVEGKQDTDLLVLRTEQGLDYHRGVIHEVTAETVRFEVDREQIPVKRARVFGLVFHRAEGRSLPAGLGLLYDKAGNRWSIQKIRLENDQLQWTSPAGLSGTTALADLVRLDVSQGKIVFLSDLEPESVRWTPFLGAAETPASQREFFAPRKDRALDPRPIQLGGKKYAKGLAIHSRTEMVYRLPRPFRRLQAVAGIDDQIRPAGHVQLVIRGDDKVLLDQAISGSDPPKPIDLDISGVRRLVILVDFGQDMDIGDHLLLGDIRLVQ